MTKVTASSKVQAILVNAFKADEQWVTTSYIAGQMPDNSIKTVYKALTELRTAPTDLGYVFALERARSVSEKEFCVNPSYMQAVTEEMALWDLPKPPAPVITLAPEGASGRKHRVDWTEEQQWMLIEKIREIRGNPAIMTILSAFHIAQIKVLPEDQRRHIQAVTSLPLTMRLELERKLPPAVTVQKPRVFIAASNTATMPEGLAAMMQSLGRSLTTPLMETLSNISTPNMVDELLNRFGNLIEQSVTNAMTSPEVLQALTTALAASQGNNAPQKTRPHNPEMATAQRTKLPTVLIAGNLKPSQRQQLSKPYAGKVDLRFWSPTDDAPSKLRAQSRVVDHVLLMTSSIGHKNQAQLDADSISYVRIAGRQNALAEWLDAFVTSNATA